MDGFLGTSAQLGSDLALVLSLALAAVAAFGVVRDNWSPRPAYAALRDMPK